MLDLVLSWNLQEETTLSICFQDCPVLLVGMAAEVTAFLVDSVPTVVLVETAGTGFGRIGIKPPAATRNLLRGDIPWLHWNIYNVENISLKRRRWSICRVLL